MSSRDNNLSSGACSAQKIKNFSNFKRSLENQDSLFWKKICENEFLKDMKIYQKQGWGLK